jgi:hypothetical protein
MSRGKKPVVLTRGERLRDSAKQGTSVTLPLAIYHRLDLIAEFAEAAGATRAEIIGMLIADAELDESALEQAVIRYRKLKVGDVIPEEPEQEPEVADAANVVSIRPRSPGRPPVSEQSRLGD